MQQIKNTKPYINCSDIIIILADQYPNVTNQKIKQAVKSMFATITDALAHNRKIELRNFGNFSTRFRSKRNARNPKTGEQIKLLAKHVVHFKPGKALNAKINKIDTNKKP